MRPGRPPASPGMRATTPQAAGFLSRWPNPTFPSPRRPPRAAGYGAHSPAARRFLKPMPKPDFAIGPTPSRAEMTSDMRAVFEREWRDIEAGLFAPPRALAPAP